MTIASWIFFGIIVFCVGILALAFIIDNCTSASTKILALLVAAIIIIGSFCGFRWYHKNTAAGQRALIDQKSSMSQGLERTITVYTANGDVIAQYTGIIDIAKNDGGYVKFDFEGKRYIYYNCFVETIADIG